MKTEPGSYSIDDLEREGKTLWTGVRNYQARNFMNAMEVGDEILFHHSSTAEIGIYGLARVYKKAVADPTQFDRKDSHFDPKATKDKPIWFSPEITFVKKYEKPLLLSQLKLYRELEGMLLLEKGSRLSVQSVSERHFKKIQSISQ